ncbi:hypothetical protein ACJX0J_024796 [Zea mays]
MCCMLIALAHDPITQLMGPSLGRVPLHLLFVSLMGSGLNEVNSVLLVFLLAFTCTRLGVILLDHLVQMTEFLSVAAYVLNATSFEEPEIFTSNKLMSKVLHKLVLDDITVTLPDALNICCYCA